MEQQQQRKPTKEEIEAMEKMEQRMMLREALTHLRCLTRLKDNVMTFCFGSRTYKMRLPLPTQDASQMMMLDAGNFKNIPDLVLLSGMCPDGGVIVDVGAHMGENTLFFATQCRAAVVVAFEAMDINYALLRTNLELNNIPNVKAYNQALGEKAGHAEWTLSPMSLMDSSKSRMKYSDNGPLDVVTLDSMDLRKLDLLNISVEGVQLEILKGAKETIGKMKPVISVELPVDDSKQQEQRPPQMRPMHDLVHELNQPKRLLTEYGYRIIQISTFRYLAVPEGRTDLLERLQPVAPGS